jgi:hypothetical protein
MQLVALSPMWNPRRCGGWPRGRSQHVGPSPHLGGRGPRLPLVYNFNRGELSRDFGVVEAVALQSEATTLMPAPTAPAAMAITGLLVFASELRRVRAPCDVLDLVDQRIAVAAWPACLCDLAGASRRRGPIRLSDRQERVGPSQRARKLLGRILANGSQAWAERIGPYGMAQQRAFHLDRDRAENETDRDRNVGL